jgi:hypothetical protein
MNEKDMTKEEKEQYYYNLQSEAMIYRDTSKWVNNGEDPFDYQHDVDKFTKKLKESKQ